MVGELDRAANAEESSSMAPMIRLLVPTAETAMAAQQLEARPAEVRSVAFLHNGQPHYDEIAPQLLTLLEQRLGLSVRRYRKPRYSSPAEPAVLDEIAASCDAAIVGLAC